MRRIAKVIKNNALTESPELVENGAIQIYIENLMQDIPKDMYPWVMPNTEWSSNVPEIGDFVWVEFLDEENWRNGFYGNTVTLREAYSHTSAIGSITSIYPDVKYITLANGVSFAMSSDPEKPEVSITTPSAEIYIDPDGGISIQGPNGSLEFSTLGETTKQFLSDILDAIISHTHGSGTGPTSNPLNAVDFTTLKTTDLETILSEEVKNS
jgi:hypothetical protein